MKVCDITTYYFNDDGTIPNNDELPVLVYHQVLAHCPKEIEYIFNTHNWRNSWINGVFDYHHYHSNVHEVLGVISGTSTIQLGGERGERIEVSRGDVFVLPAGTGHKRLHATSDFRVVGAYPNGMNYNIKTGEPTERPEVLQEIKQVMMPSTDPVYGSEGPLINYWSRNGTITRCFTK
ncbi:cupin domain-containing protein [Bacillus sp. CGMCC 1.16541]|uniref:cupin domain-containing protein n=1 Tax=Bacillus sp. CGMCC 1.16541 TaxID=2185143 RepID=UPI000D7324E2|nr:cupin domain-containing protein [Bacillus sp. CGMCC 1.16541]